MAQAALARHAAVKAMGANLAGPLTESSILVALVLLRLMRPLQRLWQLPDALSLAIVVVTLLLLGVGLSAWVGEVDLANAWKNLAKFTAYIAGTAPTLHLLHVIDSFPMMFELSSQTSFETMKQSLRSWSEGMLENARRKAAEQGDSHAQFNLGKLFFDGTGVKRDRAASDAARIMSVLK